MAFQTLALQGALLVGLVLTGTVEGEAQANRGPERVEVLIETTGYRLHRMIYFKDQSTELTREAQIVLMEIADEIAASEDPSVTFLPAYGDEILTGQRIDAVVASLSDAGFSMARVYQPPEIDIILARDL
jgi:hypothetical protein